MSGKRGADQVAEGDEELEDEIRKKVKEAHQEYEDDDLKEDLEKRLMRIFWLKSKEVMKTRNLTLDQSKALMSGVYKRIFDGEWDEEWDEAGCNFTASKKLVCPEHMEDPFSQVEIDTTLSGFDRRDVEILQDLYLTLAYGPKLSYFVGDAKFAMRKLDLQTPGIENIIFGDCQSGKSAEAAFAAWCSIYMLGCVPVVLIRNKGGKVQGSADMVKALGKMNQRVEEVLKQRHPDIDPKRFTITIIEKDSEMRTLLNSPESKTAALVMLNNSVQLKKLMHKVNLDGNRRLFPATIVGDTANNGKWRVRYRDTGEEEDVNEHDLRLNPNTRKPQKGNTVTARMSDELRMRPSVFKTLEQRFDQKEERVRAIFIVDEGDQAVGSPHRNKTVGDRLHYYDAATEMAGGKGARSYVYGSISVTATPAALFLCAFKSLSCGICDKPLEGGQQAMRVNCEHEHAYHAQCMKTFFDGDTARKEAFFCPSCEKMHAGDKGGHAQESDDDSSPEREEMGSEQDPADSEDAEDGVDDSEEAAQELEMGHEQAPAGSEDAEDGAREDGNEEAAQKLPQLREGDCEKFTVPPEYRHLRTRVIRTDRPDNYVSYEELTVPGDKCMKIVRKRLAERERTSKNEIDIYKDIWLGRCGDEPMGNEEDWDRMVKDAERESQELGWGPGLKLVRTRNTVAVRPMKSKMTPEENAIRDRVKETKKSLSDFKSPFEIDRHGIVVMIQDMFSPESSSFRHALISTQNTVLVRQQTSVQHRILDIWVKKNLAVLTYNHQSIDIMFTEKYVTDSPDLVARALKTAQDEYVNRTGARANQGNRDLRECAEKSIVAINENGISIGISIKFPEIGYAYHVLKQIGCTKSVAITGAIGGRGVSFHDFNNDTVLTDMYCAYNVKANSVPTWHGEQMIQQCGRLNTIIKPGVDVAQIKFRLWAPESVHTYHVTHIKQNLEFAENVQREGGNLQKALENLRQWTVPKPAPRTPHARHSRPAFSGYGKLGDIGPQGEQMTIEVPEAREIQRSLKLSEVIHTPAGAFATLDNKWPHGRTAETDDEKEHLWTPHGAETFNKADHIIFLVRVPSNTLDSAKVEEQFLQSNYGLEFRRDARGAVLTAEFKTRQAAFDFLTSGVLGEEEARHWEETIKLTRFEPEDKPQAGA